MSAALSEAELRLVEPVAEHFPAYAWARSMIAELRRRRVQAEASKLMMSTKTQ